MIMYKHYNPTWSTKSHDLQRSIEPKGESIGMHSETCDFASTRILVIIRGIEYKILNDILH